MHCPYLWKREKGAAQNHERCARETTTGGGKKKKKIACAKKKECPRNECCLVRSNIERGD